MSDKYASDIDADFIIEPNEVLDDDEKENVEKVQSETPQLEITNEFFFGKSSST